MKEYIRTASGKTFRTTEIKTFAVKLQPFSWEIDILAKTRRL
jgi:hypothetical protein